MRTDRNVARAARAISHLALLHAVLAVAACASSSGTSASARPATQTVGRGDIGTLVMASSGGSDIFKVPYAADAVWKILPGVFDSLAIPVNSIDPASKEIGNSALKIRARLGKVYLSRYLECGNTQLGPNADSYDVVLTVLTRVSADGAAASSLSTTVQAQAKPATYNQAYNQCSSKGAIEKRLVELVTSALSK
ncbi:MAG: hypothetical protein IT353_05860 [Gemmatimonadaceae bacterium]|nr:hypothetical protein [Gemmatimonadaceae bacterium]